MTVLTCILAVLAFGSVGVGGFAPDTEPCGAWSVGGLRVGMSFDEIRTVFPTLDTGKSGHFRVIRVRRGALLRADDLSDMELCVSPEDRVTWVRGTLRRPTAGLEESWRRKLDTKHRFPIGCVDYVTHGWTGVCTTVLWSDCSQAAILVDKSVGRTRKQSVALRQGIPDFIKVEETTSGRTYRNVSTERANEFTLLVCE